MNFKNRIDKLGKAIGEIRLAKDGFRCVFRNPEETSEQCLARHGLEKDFPGLTVHIFKWASGEGGLPNHAVPWSTTPKTETVSEIDSEIEQVKKELLADGMTAQEISEIEEKHRDKSI